MAQVLYPTSSMEPTSLTPNKCAVFARNVCKTYGDGPVVLNKLDMNVPKGNTYSLLGSSGCGKTTLLSCMVGLTRWDSGERYVLGLEPNITNREILSQKLGYMPQDLSLYSELYAEEIFRFYGRLYNMTYGNKVSQRWDTLKRLLDFSDNMGLIKDISGGERRRALVHSPELLLLDEPTVGLDPILREIIWSYLQNLVKTQNTTIIITTHYIEESRTSDMIGLVRDGRLIIEASLTSLLQKYQCVFLEDVVTLLCRRMETQSRHKENTLKISNLEFEFEETTENEVDSGDVKGISSGYSFMSRFWGKSKSYTDLLFLAIFLLLPTIQCSLCLIEVGSPFKYMGFRIVNNDLTNWSTDCGLFQELERWETCGIKAINCGYLNKLCRGRHTNAGKLSLSAPVTYENEDQALLQAQNGKIRGYLSIPTNFSEHMSDFAVEKLFATNNTLDGTRLRFRLDHSEIVIVQYIVKHLHNAYIDYTNQLANFCGLTNQALKLPIEFRKPVYGNYEDNYQEFALSGNILMALFSLSALLSAIVFITDYKKGTLARSRVAGLNISDIFISHFLIQTVLALVQTGLVTAVAHFVFGVSMNGSILAYLLTCWLTVVAAMQLGLLMGIVFRDELGALIFTMFMYCIWTQFGGTALPTELASSFWQQLGYLISLKYPVISMRSIMIREVGLMHPLVWRGLIFECSCILVLTIANIIAFKIPNM